MLIMEDLKENAILFSLNTKRSWLRFGNAYLPIFKNIVKRPTTSEWDYLLFELRRISSGKEYIVVEKEAPHRILVTTQKDVEIPKIISNMEKAVKFPQKLSGLRKLFGGESGYLKEVNS